MAKIKKFLNHFEGYLCVIMLIAMSIIVFMQVVCRFILKSSLPWSEEASRYLLVWVTFLGGAYGVREKAHLGVEAFLMFLPDKVRKYIALFVNVLCIALCCLLFKLGSDIVAGQMARVQYSPAIRIPMGYMYLVLPISMALFIIRYVQQLVETLKEMFGKNKIENEEEKK